MQDKLKERMGYSKFVEALRSLGQPSKELLEVLLDLVGTLYSLLCLTYTCTLSHSSQAYATFTYANVPGRFLICRGN